MTKLLANLGLVVKMLSILDIVWDLSFFFHLIGENSVWSKITQNLFSCSQTDIKTNFCKLYYRTHNRSSLPQTSVNYNNKGLFLTHLSCWQPWVACCSVPCACLFWDLGRRCPSLEHVIFMAKWREVILSYIMPHKAST